MNLKCARPNCPCSIKPGEDFDLLGKKYCCKVCAEQCTDQRCTCTPCECPR